MTGKVLMLNATYEPLSFISVKRAVVLLLKEKAEPLELSVERKLRSEHACFDVPLVIRLSTFVRVPRRFTVPVSRKGVLSRDNYTCQYCGIIGVPLTIDHVQPRAKGGESVWENLVAACNPCNHRKGNHLCDEVGMYPSSPPLKPSYIAMALLGEARKNEVWSKYIYA